MAEASEHLPEAQTSDFMKSWGLVSIESPKPLQGADLVSCAVNTSRVLYKAYAPGKPRECPAKLAG